MEKEFKIEPNFYETVYTGAFSDSTGFTIDSTPKTNTVATPPPTSNIVAGPNGSVLVGGYFQSPNFVAGASGWRINANGDIEANDGNFRGDITGASGTFSGSITATTGSIGGWNINSTSIYTGTEDHSGYTSNPGDLTIYSDGSNASIHANKFYIDVDGILNCTAAIIGGSVITNSSIGSIPNDSSTDLSLLTLTHDLVFSSSDTDTVAWTSGTITFSNGRTFSIDAGNTGNMSARTYIYLDTAVSSTVLQTTTTVTSAHGANKVTLAVAINSTVKAEFLTYHGTGTRNILVDNIAANSSSTNEFVSNTAQIANLVVTNAKINDLAVDKLTAGNILSKSINLGITAGTGDVEIRSGIATGDFANAGAASGFIIGLDDSDSDKAKFYFGSPTNYIKYDGSTVSVAGTITATAGTIGGFDIGTDYIRDAANSFGLASTVSGSDDIRFWAGSTFANRATAPFRVTEAGVVYAKKRVVTVTQSATPAINTDITDVASITGLAQAITSMTTNLTGTPNSGDLLIVQITDNGTARAITWGASFASTLVSLPLTTTINQLLRVGFQWNTVTSKWDCIALA